MEEVNPKVRHAADEMLSKVQLLHHNMLESVHKNMDQWPQVRPVLADLKKELEAAEASILVEAYKKQGVVKVVVPTTVDKPSKPAPRVVTVSGFSYFLSGWNGDYILQSKKVNNAPVWKCPSHVHKGFPPIPIIGNPPPCIRISTSLPSLSVVSIYRCNSSLDGLRVGNLS